jgi:predicted DNA-binding protein YlxM (UPF0122 family)
MLDPIARLSLLNDFYGSLLTSRQQEVMRLYHEENLSLSEIAEEFGISRQGVHDTLKNAEHAILEYEDKLGLVARLEDTKQDVVKIDGLIARMLSQNQSNPTLTKELEQIKEIINRLNA